MLYRTNPKNGDKLSILGFGFMRFAKDKKEAEKQVIYAIENGVNYFDTAYVYPNSEAVLGSILAKGYRDRVKIATKLPHFLVKKNEDLDKIFYKELERLQTEYIDYYLIHMLSDIETWKRLLNLGILQWIEEKKQQGKIKNIGFSYHGDKEEFIKLVDVFDWEFCMIQYNFLDEFRQVGKSGLEYAAAKGLPVMVMEPLRGGKLVSNLPKEVYAVWKNAHVKRTPAEWALRWVWNHPEVTVTLSGMNTQEMIEENIKIASQTEANSFTENDFALFTSARNILLEKIKVPCTACNYCMPCPFGVYIPDCFSCYNDVTTEGKFKAFQNYIQQTGLKSQAHDASLCTKCGKCEQHCPQKIAIRTELSNAAKEFDGLIYRAAKLIIRKFLMRS